MAEGQHIPAWKRLGLTLKHAKDVPAPSPQAANSKVQSSVADHDKGSKRSRDETGSPQNIKKIKLSNAAPLSSPASKQQKENISIRTSPEKSNLKKSPTKPGDRRKSVSFSQDTKTEDGDTAQNAFKAWVAEQNALEAGAEEFAARIAAQEAQQAAQSHLDPTKPDPILSPKKETKDKKGKKDKKEKKEKPTKPESSSKSVPVPDQPQKKVKTRTPKPTTDKPVPEYVHYLTTFHTDRPSWKFNKSKQNDLLKNVWNIYRVPSEHNDALVEYISGLQGNGARQRLQDSARTIITSNVTFIRAEIPEVKDEKMDTSEARRAAFEAAEKRELDKLRELGLDLGENNDTVQTLRQKRDEGERADQLLRVLGQAISEMRREEKEKEKKDQSVDTARAKRKKRKARTVASDSDSDSDSDNDSSSDSDSDSDSDATTKSSPKKKQKTKAKSDDESSSSSSSDSDSDSSDSSGSDSDEESGSDGDSDESSSDDDEISSSDSSDDDSSDTQ